jgi:hypothetical protein
LGEIFYLRPHLAVLSDKSIEHSNGVRRAGADGREQNFLFGAKVGDEIIVKEPDRICGLLLRTIRGLPVTWQPLAQTKSQDQAVVMVVREGDQAGVTFGRHENFIANSQKTKK